MRIEELPMRCLACGAEFKAEVVQDAGASVVVASWRALRCPGCGVGWKRIAFRYQPSEAVP
jgi:uncharacterized Zn finger protein